MVRSETGHIDLAQPYPDITICDPTEHENASSPGNERATLIVPTSGNFGLALAGLAAKRGNYRVVAIVPERTTNDRIQMLKALGAEIMRTPNEARPEAPESAYSTATRLAGQLKDAIVMDEVC